LVLPPCSRSWAYCRTTRPPSRRPRREVTSASFQLLRRSPRGARGPAGARNRRSGPWRSGSYAEPPVHPLQLRTHALVGEKSLRPGRYSCPAWRGPACQIRARSFRDLSLRVTQLHQLADAARRAGVAAPVDQPGSGKSHRQGPTFISTLDTSGAGHAVRAPPVSPPGQRVLSNHAPIPGSAALMRAPPRSRSALSRCGESPRSGDDPLPAFYLSRSNPGPVRVPGRLARQPARGPRAAGACGGAAVRAASAARLAPVQKFPHRIMVRRL